VVRRRRSEADAELDEDMARAEAALQRSEEARRSEVPSRERERIVHQSAAEFQDAHADHAHGRGHPELAETAEQHARRARERLRDVTDG
jgi:hypothetical protein